MNKVEFEAARVLAAFGLYSWVSREEKDSLIFFNCLQTRSNLTCAITKAGSQAVEFSARDYYGRYLEVWFVGDRWLISFPYRKSVLSETLDFMVRGLYRLDFQDQSVLSQLPFLSAHEKLELRLSMPRTFWAQSWFNEREEIISR